MRRMRVLSEADCMKVAEQAARNSNVDWRRCPAEVRQRMARGVGDCIRAMMDLKWIVAPPDVGALSSAPKQG
jgi:hypothetical protein